MSPATLKVPGRTLGDWLHEINRERRTGKLQIDVAGDERELFFLAGDLYLAPGHPAYDAVKTWTVETRSGTDDSSDESEGVALPGDEATAPPFRQLTGLIIRFSGGAGEIDCVFVSGPGQIRIDLVGPLPTKQLIMECAVWGAEEADLWRRLGGPEISLRACSDLNDEIQDVQLEPREAFLLTRLSPSAVVGELVRQLDLGKDQVLRSLCRLLAVGLVQKVAEEGAGESTSEPRGNLVDRLAQSIEESLDREPLEIESEAHKELLGELFSRMGEVTYFELLAVSPQSSDEEIHQAYFELGRLVHPRHVEKLGLSGKEGAFRVLFEQATEAYLTLNDPVRKLEYIEDIGPSSQAMNEGLTGEKRDQERQELARSHFEKALALAERQDYHSAIQLLEQAVSADPQIEYMTLLGDCQAENPQWLDRAADSYQKALLARPNDPSLHSRLGRVHERRGAKQEAKRAYESALELAPEMESARAGLWRLGGGESPTEKPSLVDRLRRLLRF